MRSGMIYIYTDGASRSNPGESASGYQIFDERYKLIVKHSFYNGIKTNNEAEYLAIIAALEKAGAEFGYEKEVHLFSDSQLVVRQLKREYKVRDAGLRELHSKALDLLVRFRSCKLENVPRENKYISMVDGELNDLLDSLGK
jgi:ribonuclease HI